MPRILFLSNIPTPYQLDFLGTLAARTEICAVFLWAKQSNLDWNIAHPDWLHTLDYDPASGWAKLKRILDEFQPDTIIVGGYRLPLATRIKWHSFMRGLRFFYWLEKPLPSHGLKAALRAVVWRLTLPYANGVLCIGSEAANSYGPLARTTLNLPYSINLARYPMRASDDAQLPLRFLFAGQYIHRKGVQELLEAFSAISPASASLSLIGSGELQEMVADYAARFPHIKTLGFVEPSALPALFTEHDVFILPSRHDGWAVVVAEAMAAGLPVIGTYHTGAFVDLVAPNQCGWACEVDAESIKSALDYYIAHPQEARKQGAKGRSVLERSVAVSHNAADALLRMLG